MNNLKTSDLKVLHDEQDKKELVLKEFSDKEKIKKLTTEQRVGRIEQLLGIE